MRWLPLVAVLSFPTAAFAQSTTQPPPTVPVEEPNEKSTGAQGYMGGVVGGLLPVILNNGGVGAQFAVRGGVLYNGFQFQLEVAPASTIIGAVAREPLALFDVTGSIGYLIPMNEMVSWIVRFGGGGGALLGVSSFASGSNLTFGEFRADVAGVAIRTSKHLLVECNAPSFRVMVIPNWSAMVMWVTNVGINYVF